MSKQEVFEIAESSKKECLRLEEEVSFLKKQVGVVINEVKELEIKAEESKRALAHVSKNFQTYSQLNKRSL